MINKTNNLSEALKGLRVLDLTRLLPGPYATLMLADMGAEVIKVEDTDMGDYIRGVPPLWSESKSYLFELLNRNKKGITLNLKKEKGVEIFRELVRNSNIVCESFRPGVAEKLGIDYENLKKINPELIYCSVTGYGQTSRMKNIAGHDVNYLAYSGFFSDTSDRKIPVLMPTQLADLAGGSLMMIISLLGAIINLKNGKGGVHLDISLTHSSFTLLPVMYSSAFSGDKQFQEFLSGGNPCYNFYKTADNKYLAFAALEPKFWFNFCNRICREDLLSLSPLVVEDKSKLKEELEKIFLSKEIEYWQSLGIEADACISSLLSIEDAIDFTQDENYNTSFQYSDKGKIFNYLLTQPLINEDKEKILIFPAPELSEHNIEIYGKLLKFEASTLNQLKKEDII